MAQQANNLFSSATSSSPRPRIHAAPGHGSHRANPLAAVSGAPTLPIGMPMAFNSSTSLWVPFTQGGSNDTDQIRGFLLQPVDTSATEESIGIIMLRGTVHRDDVNTAAIRALCGGAPSEAQVDTALRDSLRGLGIDVLGLSGVVA